MIFNSVKNEQKNFKFLFLVWQDSYQEYLNSFV